MKKVIIFLIIIILFFSVDATIVYLKNDQPIVNVTKEDDAMRGVYISYLEYMENFFNGSKTINKHKIDKMIDNLVESKINTIFLQVSPFSDAIYDSKLFPYSYTLTGTEGKNPGFDYLDYFIKVAHLKKIKIHAWINPYRVSFDNNTDKISKNNPAYQIINTSNIKVDKMGIYYNPSSEIVKNLIVRQIEEIINKYLVDGIHFDDYFYIQNDIDTKEYEIYQQNGGKLSLKEFRLYHTNDLIRRVYKTIKNKNENIVFSIAPDGNINNNYLYHFADVKTWLKEEDYIDIIMPQIYYGFRNEYLPFDRCLDNWLNIRINNKIKIMPVLAFYKIDKEDIDAGNGKNEWINNTLIINKQINYLKKNDISDFALFRYDFMYNEKFITQKGVNEIVNIKKIN